MWFKSGTIWSKNKKNINTSLLCVYVSELVAAAVLSVLVSQFVWMWISSELHCCAELQTHESNLAELNWAADQWLPSWVFTSPSTVRVSSSPPSLCTVNFPMKPERCENNLSVSLWTDDHSSSAADTVLHSRRSFLC